MSLAVDIIKASEGLRLKAYSDSAGVWTIGWGHTKGVVYSKVITEEQAEEFLREDMAWVLTLIGATVKVQLNENQHAAVASLIFNIGAGQWKTSTALRRLNAGNYSGAAEALTWFKKIRVDGVLEISDGLVARRERERVLFVSVPTMSVPSTRGAAFGGEAKPMIKSKTAWIGFGGVLTSILTVWSQLRLNAPEVFDLVGIWAPALLGAIFLIVMLNRYLDSRRGVH